LSSNRSEEVGSRREGIVAVVWERKEENITEEGGAEPRRSKIDEAG
jgi:hypothetical protein